MTDDPTVKTLLEDKAALENVVDEETRRQLERWFELPSFTELEEKKKAAPPTDTEMAEAIARRDKALAAIDEATLVEVERRNAKRAQVIDEHRDVLTVSAQRPTALADFEMIDRGYQVGEPREITLPSGIEDDLRECAPQALLRDLHRPETDFYKEFEITDAIAEGRVDASKEANVAMTTRWKIDPRRRSIFDEGRALLLELRAERKLPWQRVNELALAHRRVRE